MQTIPAYLYQNTIQCQIIVSEDLSATRSFLVYSNPIKIYKNNDNPIRIVFRNKDQKRTRINALEFTFYLYGTNSPTKVKVADSATEYSEIDTDNVDVTVPVLVKTVTVIDDGVLESVKGVAQLMLTSEDLANLTADSYLYAIKATGQTGSFPVYSDDNLGVTGIINLIGGVF